MNGLPIAQLFEFGLSVEIIFCDRHCGASYIEMAMLSIPILRRVRVMKRQFSKIVVCCAACVTQGWGQSNDKSKQLVANSKPTLPPFSEHWEAHGYILENIGAESMRT